MSADTAGDPPAATGLDAEIREDLFLGGRVRLRQPVRGYRAGADAVMLAAACPARPGHRVLDLGCGAGAAILCLMARVPDLAATGIERDPQAAALAAVNAPLNGRALRVIEGDVACMPPQLRAETFDHVIANPPFFPAGTRPPDAGRAAARHEDTSLETWIDAGLRRLRPGGSLTVIHRAEALGRILAALSGRAGGATILPLAARTGRPAERIIVTARKGARGPLRLLAPFVLHAAPVHLADGEDLADEAQAVLRHAAPMAAAKVVLHTQDG